MLFRSVNIARELGLLQPLLDAGAFFTTDWVFYDAAIPAEVAESMAVDASTMPVARKRLQN